MNIHWYTKEELSYNFNMADLTHLIDSNSDIQLQSTIHLVFEKEALANKFFEQFQRFNFFFKDLYIKVGILNFSSQAINTEEEGQYIFFVNSPTGEAFANAFKNKAVMINHSCLGHIKTIAFQRHITEECKNVLNVSLGEFKTDFSTSEALIRSEENIFFASQAIRKQDSGLKNAFITGLDIYEAAQITRFIGLSDNLKNLYFIADEITETYAECLATLFWYFCEGLSQRTIDETTEVSDQIYMVENEFFEETFEFIQAHPTKRWWFIHPQNGKRIPCSEQDYKSFREGEIPEAILAHITMG